MSKKHDLPAMPFYFGDWMKCPEVRAMDLETRMIWFEMLGFMWESTERGYLTLNGSKIENSMLARMLGITEERLTLSLTIMGKLNVYSVREKDGAIYNRRMIRDEEIRHKRIQGGYLGGNPVLINKDDKDNLKGYPKHKPSPEDENENENKDVIINKIKDRSIKFLEEINTFKEYEISMLNEFYSYWSEPNKSKTKMRCELQPTWDLSRRLKTWADRQKTKPQQRYGRQEVSMQELRDQAERIKLS
jgi:hypothetical protein